MVSNKPEPANKMAGPLKSKRNATWRSLLESRVDTDKCKKGGILRFRIGKSLVDPVGHTSSCLSDVLNTNAAEAEQTAHKTVYNPSAKIEGKYMLCRYESLRREDDTECRFFLHNQENDEWEWLQNSPILTQLQDPFYCGLANGWHIFGGVQITKKEAVFECEITYRTVFYRFKGEVSELFSKESEDIKPFAISLSGNKDIRLCVRSNGKIAVFQRPQGGVFGPGRITYQEINHIDELSTLLESEVTEDCQIKDIFLDKNEWGGANQVFPLENGKIGVLGHIAHEEIAMSGEKTKNYYAMTFIYDPESKSATNMKIVATIDDFPKSRYKREELKGVVFSGAIERLGEGIARLYAGLGDRQVGWIEIQDPFWEPKFNI